ncbi:hydroxymethylbilane synthase [Candidatus Avoscillospira sp. LCP25S3_F1]|uniref:hydroxymethylbilane synthase n=1 Tax=Candidatus Avoscillospira sp. LCP25S3_F1 TaxID=3438825 RepID=UPI003F93AC3D
MKQLRIGSRESRLAVIQSEQVADYLRSQGVDAPLVTMKTTGDIILDRTLDKIGGKGLFVKELDKALLDGRSDLSVHSTKDLPMEIPPELPIVGFSKREDPRDVLVLPEGCTEWDKTKPVGCASRRRMLQLQDLYPEVTFAPVRGNVLTRLNKLDVGQYGALILAAAGLKRLGLEHRISRYFSTEEMIPAAGQGILCIQGRAGEDYSALAGFLDDGATACVTAERAFVTALDGGCSSPIAAFAHLDGETLHLRGLYYSEAHETHTVGTCSGPAADAASLGARLAAELKEQLDGGTQ